MGRSALTRPQGVPLVDYMGGMLLGAVSVLYGSLALFSLGSADLSILTVLVGGVIGTACGFAVCQGIRWGYWIAMGTALLNLIFLLIQAPISFSPVWTVFGIYCGLRLGGLFGRSPGTSPKRA